MLPGVDDIFAFQVAMRQQVLLVLRLLLGLMYLPLQRQLILCFSFALLVVIPDQIRISLIHGLHFRLFNFILSQDESCLIDGAPIFIV